MGSSTTFDPEHSDGQRNLGPRPRGTVMHNAASLALLAFAAAGLVADPKPKDKAMSVRKVDVKVEGEAKGRPAEPTVIRTAEELAKAIPDEKAFAAVRRAVDFEREQVVYFTWSGSGQDKVEFDVKEGTTPEITFTYTRGRTRDVRHHNKLFAMPKGATHKVVTAGRRRLDFS